MPPNGSGRGDCLHGWVRLLLRGSARDRGKQVESINYKEQLMSEDKMKLAGLEKVNILGGLRPRLMEIADPPAELFYDRLTREELVKVAQIGIRYQQKLVDVEMSRLKAQSEALAEMERAMGGMK
jgi:hypothetical protein